MLIPLQDHRWPDPVPAAQDITMAQTHPRQDALPSQGCHHRHSGWAKSDALAHLPCTSSGCGGSCSARKEPTQTWGACTNPTQTVTTAQEWFFFLINIVTKWCYSRTCHIWHFVIHSNFPKVNSIKTFLVTYSLILSFLHLKSSVDLRDEEITPFTLISRVMRH